MQHVFFSYCAHEKKFTYLVVQAGGFSDAINIGNIPGREEAGGCRDTCPHRVGSGTWVYMK